MKAELVPDNGDPPIVITKDLTVVGRRDYCDVVVDDRSISKRHCVLVKTDGLLVIRDLGSTNGTKVKGQRVRWAALLPDDRISLGTYKFRIYLGPDDTPGPSELVAIRRARALASAQQPADDLPSIAVEGSPVDESTQSSDPKRGPAEADTPLDPDGRIPGIPPKGDIDPAFANTKTPTDGLPVILEID